MYLYLSPYFSLILKKKIGEKDSWSISRKNWDYFVNFIIIIATNNITTVAQEAKIYKKNENCLHSAFFSVMISTSMYVFIIPSYRGLVNRISSTDKNGSCLWM